MLWMNKLGVGSGLVNAGCDDARTGGGELTLATFGGDVVRFAAQMSAQHNFALATSGVVV